MTKPLLDACTDERCTCRPGDVQGRCHNCQVRWVWKRTPARPLSRAWCPKCGGPLRQTTHRVRLVMRRRPIPIFSALRPRDPRKVTGR